MLKRVKMMLVMKMMSMKMKTEVLLIITNTMREPHPKDQ